MELTYQIAKGLTKWAVFPVLYCMAKCMLTATTGVFIFTAPLLSLTSHLKLSGQKCIILNLYLVLISDKIPCHKIKKITRKFGSWSDYIVLLFDKRLCNKAGEMPARYQNDSKILSTDNPPSEHFQILLGDVLRATETYLFDKEIAYLFLPKSIIDAKNYQQSLEYISREF